MIDTNRDRPTSLIGLPLSNIDGFSTYYVISRSHGYFGLVGAHRDRDARVRKEVVLFRHGWCLKNERRLSDHFVAEEFTAEFTLRRSEMFVERRT